MKPYQGALVCAVLVMGLGYPAMRQAPKQSGRAANAQQIEHHQYVVEIGGCDDCRTAGYAEAGGKAAEADSLKGDTSDPSRGEQLTPPISGSRSAR